MKSLRLLSAIALCLAILAVTSSVARADSFVVGRVVQLVNFPGLGYSVMVQTTTDRIEVQIAEDLFNTLEIGDTVVLRGETWSLLHKGIGEGSVGTGTAERTR